MQPKPIRTNASNEFAHESFKRRLPSIIREIQANNTFPSAVTQQLDHLHEALVTNAPIPAPSLPDPNADVWRAAYQQHHGETWQNSEWLYAETYFFHLINQIVRYWQTNQDPYHALKAAELTSETLQRQVETAQAIQGNPEERLALLLEMALWGNRVDLSLPEVMASHGQAAAIGDLLADERPAAVERLRHSTGMVHLITDNFGTELAMDLALIDYLLSLSIPVMLHVKMHPTYVSDATAADVQWMLSHFSAQNQPFAKRLQIALEDGRLQVAPDFFWNSPHFLDKLPPRLLNLFAEARLLILKGDANYRRAFFDTIWQVDTPTKHIVNYLPAPLLCLRTLKSDCLAGVSTDAAAQAEMQNPKWRVLGKYGVIQYVAP